MSQKFQPHLFISIGATGAYFTLRETYLHMIYTRGGGPMGGAIHNGVYQGTVSAEVWSLHHCNLSQDADEAYAKAQQWAEKLALPLTTTREEMREEMRKIQRMNAAQIAERNARIEKMEREYSAYREKREREYLEALEHGIMPIGKHAGEWLVDLPLGYLEWLRRAEFEDGSLMVAIQRKVIEECEDRFLPVPVKDEFVGKEKQRLEFEAVCIRAGSYARPGYGFRGMELVNVSTFCTATNHCVVVKSTAFSAKIGERLKFKATVKAHDVYKGQAQTVVQRVKVIEEQGA